MLGFIFCALTVRSLANILRFLEDFHKGKHTFGKTTTKLILSPSFKVTFHINLPVTETKEKRKKYFLNIVFQVLSKRKDKREWKQIIINMFHFVLQKGKWLC